MARKSRNKRRLQFILTLSLTALVLYLFLVPDIAKLKKENPEITSFMEYRENEWKREGKHYRIHQKWVRLSRISPYLIKAVLIGEDDKFWSHEGFDYEAIQKAIEKDVRAKRFKLGGSTISQQLAKNLYLSPSKNIFRKIREAIITWRMERILTKKRILELYLNVVEWGDAGIFGAEMAARHYYGKSAADLTAGEAARLAAVLPNPRKYNPLGNSRYVIHRSNLIYSIMVRRGIVVPEYNEVVTEADSDQKVMEGRSPDAPVSKEPADGLSPDPSASSSTEKNP